MIRCKCTLYRTAIFAAVVLSAWSPLPGTVAIAAPRGDGQLEIELVDSDTGKPLAARMRLRNSLGRPVALRLPGIAEFGGHFYVDGRLAIPLSQGQYTFELDSGPEFRTQNGHFQIERHADDAKRIEMKRVANLAQEGWYGGDLDVVRRSEDLPLIMRAEGLHVVPTRAAATGTRHLERLAIARPASPPSHERDEPPSGPFVQLIQRPGGDLLMFNLTAPFDPSGTDYSAALEFNPLSSRAVMRAARRLGGRLVARTPYAWDLPVWLASGELDAIELIHHHALSDGVLDNEQDGRPRDTVLFPGRTGNGRWSEAVYYRVLNCGLRIPPVAGSGSGTNDNPVGTNRVYVECGGEFTSARWWEGLEAGRVVVTNGPLLRPRVEGHPPGYVFPVDDHGSLTLEIGLGLATRVPIDYLQIVKNGEVEAEVRLADWTNRRGRLPPLHFDASGWFLVRAVTNNDRAYQLASSGPYYVERAGQPRVSRRSVQFFLDWIDAASARLGAMSNLDRPTRTALLAEQRDARQFFEELLSKANAD